MMKEQKGPLKTAEEFAKGILRVVESEMEKAIRVISIDRGFDPREFTLVAFGGGGPLHACSLARALRIPNVLIPAAPGALSAIGILLADTVRDYSRTVMLPGDHIERLGDCFAELEERGRAEFASEGIEGEAQRTIDVRYSRQGYELNVGWDEQFPRSAIEAFHQLHKQSYGFCDPARPVEIVNLRLRMIAAGDPYTPTRQEFVSGDGHAACYAEREVFFDGGWEKSRIYRRDQLVAGDVLSGPATITEYTAATLLPLGDRAQVDGFGNLVVNIGKAGCA
jgi:N-methylhydantoinase A